jgi:hypothetical protein
MKFIQKIIYGGFAAVALVSASMPVFSVAAYLPGTTLYGPDFEWYAQVGRPAAIVDVESGQFPHRDGAIWSPGHWEWDGYRHHWVIGHWIKDDYAEQVALYNAGPETRLALSPGPESTVTVFVEPATLPQGTLRR